MLIKVCGMRDPGNIREVARCGIDMMGFIFYPKSPRYAAALQPGTIARLKADGIEPVALFVDEPAGHVTATCSRYGFTTVQLHGSESADCCDRLRGSGLKVLKALGIGAKEDIGRAKLYDGHADMLVLDTACATKGGSGRKFDWNLLAAADFSTPYLLSGGISPDDAAAVRETYRRCAPLMAGVDLNSRFETAPGLKSTTLLSDFISKCNQL